MMEGKEGSTAPERVEAGISQRLRNLSLDCLNREQLIMISISDGMYLPASEKPDLYARYGYALKLDRPEERLRSLFLGRPQKSPTTELELMEREVEFDPKGELERAESRLRYPRVDLLFCPRPNSPPAVDFGLQEATVQFRKQATRNLIGKTTPYHLLLVTIPAIANFPILEESVDPTELADDLKYLLMFKPLTIKYTGPGIEYHFYTHEKFMGICKRTGIERISFSDDQVQRIVPIIEHMMDPRT